jgi:hypothetical protein
VPITWRWPFYDPVARTLHRSSDPDHRGARAETVAPLIAPRTTVTQIEHLIVIVGENLSFDNVFATYEPAADQRVGNLLSRGIVNKDSSPGPHFANAAQREASVRDRGR